MKISGIVSITKLSLIKITVYAAASPPEELIVHINSELLGFVGLIAAGVVTISVLLSVLPIIRMKPIDVLRISR